MKLRITEPTIAQNRHCDRGDEIEVDATEAAQLLHAGRAVPIIETATIKPTTEKAATRPTIRKRVASK